MRHVRASDVGSLARTVARWAGPDSRAVPLRKSGYPQVGSFGVTLWGWLLWNHGQPEAPPSPLFASACGARVGAHDLCRDIWRRQGKQELAPLPDFCSPDCPDCSVILDQHEESPPKEKPSAIELMTAHGRIRIVADPRCGEGYFVLQSAKAATPYAIGHGVTFGLVADAVEAEVVGNGHTPEEAAISPRNWAKLNNDDAATRMYSAPVQRPRDPASERAATLRYRLDRKLARARARP